MLRPFLGNTTYQDWVWDAFVAINATTRVGQGFSEISDVNAANGGSFLNVQESFLFAEVMKYSYLVHAPVRLCLHPLLDFLSLVDTDVFFPEIGQRVSGIR